MSGATPWSPAAYHALIGAAYRVGCATRDLLGMLLSESDGCPGPALLHHVENPNAVGLNQILLPLLHTVGWTGPWQGYEALPVEDQLVYVERWVKSRPGPKTSAAQLYLSNFLPGYWARGTDPDYVLCAPDKHPEWYFPNWRAFDPWLLEAEPKWTPPEKDHGEKGCIAVGDLGTRIARKLREARGQAMLAALRAAEMPGAAPSPPPPPPPPASSDDQAAILEGLVSATQNQPLDLRSTPPEPHAVRRRRT